MAGVAVEAGAAVVGAAEAEQVREVVAVEGESVRE